MTDETTRHTVERDGDRDLRFDGRLVASATSHHHEGPRNTRWTELELYETAGGQFVAAEIGKSLSQGEINRYAAWVCDDHEAVIEALGLGTLAKELYAKAGIDCTEEI